MDRFTIDDLRALAGAASAPCVSVFMPTHAAGPEAQQNPIRLRNLLKSAEERLVARGMRAPEARAFLGAAERLLGDSAFWRQQDDGLALFQSTEGLRSFRLPIPFESLAVVGERPHVGPLLPLFTGTGRFYLLALSQNRVRLFQAGRQAIRELQLEDVPSSLAEALRFDEVQKETQLRSPAGAAGPVVGHGHEIDEKDRILRYFQQVSRGLHDHLREERLPLVLAAVNYLMPIYREANTYPNLMSEGILGNPDEASAEDLFRRGKAIVAPYFQQAQADALARFQERAGTGGTASSIEEIVPAAAQGRVDILLTASGKHLWGHFDPASHAVQRHEAPGPDSEELIDAAVVHTLLSGGTAFALAPEAMPADSAVAAVLRY